jgi:hypothetical protein
MKILERMSMRAYSPTRLLRGSMLLTMSRLDERVGPMEMARVQAVAEAAVTSNEAEEATIEAVARNGVIVGAATEEMEVGVVEEAEAGVEAEAANTIDHLMMLGRNPTILHQLTTLLLLMRISHHCRSSIKPLSSLFSNSLSSINSTSSRFKPKVVMQGSRVALENCSTSKVDDIGLAGHCLA